MFRTVLVANRGEIACRVIGTLRRLGIRSVAVYTDVDAGARHVREADVAVRLDSDKGGGRLGYLDVDAVVAAAVRSGAQAIHPGYGFLSENPALAEACERAGVVFVGPPARAIEVMGDKVEAKRLVAKHDVPVLPGTLEGGLSDDALLAAAADVGFPLLVKPAAGGGGKGMTIVGSAGELPAALASARRVAASSFGDDDLLLERLVERPRHVEVQVLADSRGAVVHLGERECTLQRRHQKVVEEAPSPAVDEATRARLGEAACEVARSVGYVGVGTVEFLVPADDPSTFWFIEMNTRLQVEHPVTEMVTGLDLVEQQLRVASGEPLAFAQDDVRLRGHAIEARVYAESPARGFLPATGRVLALHDAGTPAGPDASPLRLDSMLLPGAEVTGDYDPLLAKAVAYGEDRDEALRRLDGLLGELVVLGVETNTGFLRDLLAHPDVRAGRMDTGLIDRVITELSGPGGGIGGREPDNSGEEWVVAAALLALRARTTAGAGVSASGPWAAGDGWRLNAPPAPRRVLLQAAGGVVHEVLVTGPLDDAAVRVDDGTAVRASLRHTGGAAHEHLLTVDGLTRPVAAVAGPGGDPAETEVWVGDGGRAASYTVLDRAAHAARRRALGGTDAGTGHAGGAAEVRAGMPGTVTAVPVADGDVVQPGATVVVVEAMKMEHPLTTPAAGVVRLAVQPGDQVRLDQVVAVVEPEEPAAEPAAPTEPTAADPAAAVTLSETRGDS
ncbi:biotin carboxylase N-terminal domain-containing protein [Isoptericola variabilis]|uniref:biotin carboxylase n=1 Tax=Isoptericola variabilis (strain 225) TaxID=743718 RepID=F6FUQ5_ISOV2|nr:biotin carboxylase N-terminal domain-containing protein [Isoptericola variabilis]AEG43316.1 Methylcrotonoyl-CoA carboxylase [Isoptericola variabilis 225]TWH35252.1 acetyl-CoA/propionyl-CoA carboxylase, biotin carboxylase, biotin carboxyl carrier protein [Isoptericola variabilis J7]